MTAPAVPRSRVALVDRLGSFGDAVALRWVGGSGLQTMSYAVLAARVGARRFALGPTPRLVLLEAGNDVETVVTLLAALAGGHPVILTGPDGSGLEQAWQPDVVARGDALVERPSEGSAAGDPDSATPPVSRHALHPDLALLLSTSGSTGSPKLVRLSTANLDCNAAQIVEALGITATDVAATTLPLQYCYGLSVLLSHLSVGASVLLTDLSVVDTCFWSAFAEAGGTTLAGVPYTFDLLDSVGFATKDLRTLRLVTQAGGRLAPEAVRRWAGLAGERGFDFVVMYGQTEATARMATLPPHLAAEHPGTIGVAVPGGHFSLAPVDGAAAGVGELVFEGGNVMMGYATTPADLARGPEVAALATGDLARFTPDGLVELVGRRSRFAKVAGLRIDLDRVESDLAEGGRTAYALDGGDRLLVALTAPLGGDLAQVRRTVSDRYAVPRAAVVVAEVEQVPRTESGKVDRPALTASLLASGDSAAGAVGGAARGGGARQRSEEIRALYAGLLDRPDAGLDDSFVSLRGDSLSYVEASVRLEGLLGELPESWHTRTIADLAEVADAADSADQGGAKATRASGRERWLRWRSLELSVLLRGLAIIAIVLTHAKLVDVQGGAHILLAVAGFAFARFQLSGRTRQDRVSHVVESVVRIAVPSAVWIAVITVIDDRYSWWNPLLLTSIGGGTEHLQWRYWFVEALVHILVLAAVLFSVPAFDRLERARPFAVPAALAVLGLVFRFGLIEVGSHHTNGRPAVVLWLFALGWAMARTEATWQRWLLTAYVLLVVPGFFPDPARNLTIAAGLLLLLWVRSVRVPAFVVPLIVPVASASLFIYLVHWEVLRRVGYTPLGVVVALFTGWIAWRGAAPLVEPLARRIGLSLRGSGRTTAAPAPATPARGS